MVIDPRYTLNAHGQSMVMMLMELDMAAVATLSDAIPRSKLCSFRELREQSPRVSPAISRITCP